MIKPFLFYNCSNVSKIINVIYIQSQLICTIIVKVPITPQVIFNEIIAKEQR